MNSTFIVERIEEMTKQTKRKRVRTKNDEDEGQRETLMDLDRIEHALLTSIDNGKDVFGGEGAVESVTDREGEGENGDGMEVGGNEEDEEEEEGEIKLTATAELTDLELRINNNMSYHGLDGLDTKIHACTKCNQRMLKFALQIHCNETHTVHTEMDEDKAEAG